MTLLTICKDVADEVQIDRPSSVIGSPQPTDMSLLRYANKVGVQLMKKVAWQALRKEQTFTALGAEEQTGILPSDFDRFIPETFWNRSDCQLVTGPVSSVEWQSLKARSYMGQPKFIYRGGSVFILPAPDGGETLAFEYVSNKWCADDDGNPQSSWAADSDVGLIDEELIKRAIKYSYLTDIGQPNGVAAAEFEDYLGLLLANDQPNIPILTAADIFGGGRHFDGVPGRSGFNIVTG